MLPKVKRARISNESQGYGYASDGSANEQEDVGRKRRKAQVPSTETTNVAVTSGGGLPADPSWTISTPKEASKKITIGKFKEKIYVNIREYYKDSADGTLKPGKKGIALSLEQYGELIRVIPQINAALAQMGQMVESQPQGDSGDDDEMPIVTRVKAKLERSNIEATSEED